MQVAPMILFLSIPPPPSVCYLCAFKSHSLEFRLISAIRGRSHFNRQDPFITVGGILRNIVWMALPTARHDPRVGAVS